MYTTLNKSIKNKHSHPEQEMRTGQLAQMLVNAMGYEEAFEKAKESHWDKVAETIRFMKSKTLRRF